VNDEIFVSIMQTPDGFNKFLASLVYTRQDNQWKLYELHIGSYSIADKNAVQWYEDAKSNYDKGYLVSAMFRLQLASEGSPVSITSASPRLSFIIRQIPTKKSILTT